VTATEPRGASPVRRARGDPGQAPIKGAAGLASGPELAGPQPPDPERAGPELPGSELPGSELAGAESAGLEPAGSEPTGLGSAGLEMDAGELPPRSRGVIGLLEENCTVCMLCARECPDWCIYIESHKQTVPAPEGGRDRVRNTLDRFAIDFSLCMYCGICIEVCPYDALFWSPEFGYPETGIGALTHERDRLRDWMWTVPPPPAHDPGAPPPREAQAADPGAGAAVESG
jgi:NADH-quinone oxidoreductase subunit I